MAKIARIALLVVLFLGPFQSVAFAQPEIKEGCPVGFHLHGVMDHDDHSGNPHRHIGTSADQNGDGNICVKHTSTQNHVHIDNPIPVD